MFGALKKLFSKSANPPPAAAPTAAKPAPAPPPAASSTPPGPSPASAPVPPSPAPRRTVTPGGEMLELPLNDILSKLPIPLAAKALSRPGGMFSFSSSVALEQLRTGAVRIPFGELRQGSPPGTFADDASQDDSLLDLPLPLILAAIGPGGLARRPDQKRTEAPVDVTGVFGTKNSPLNRATLAPSSPGSGSEKPDLWDTQFNRRKLAVSPLATNPGSAAPPLATPGPPKPAAPIFAPAAPKGGAPVGISRVPAKTTTSIPQGATATKTPTSLPFATAKPATPTPPANGRPGPLPSAGGSSGGTVVTTIDSVSGAWPDAVRQEIQKLNLEITSIAIPVNRLEPGIKAGRVIFTWADVSSWLSVPIPKSAHGEVQVELPLKVVAPLFLAKHRAAAPRKVVAVDENLPDLFTGTNRPAPAQSAAPPAPIAAPVIAPPPAAPATAPNVLEEILGQPSKQDWTPDEIAQRILALPGVSGAVLASSDGLLVAGRMPAPLKAETMAAFLPQIFTRIGGCAEQAQLGTLRAVRLSAGPAPCGIFKAGTLYLAVLGHPGQTLPEPALERVAGELAQQKY
jgi:predicted regulator of Ras-like GTPase activity (Roadblock/LC7/MglB family)